MQRATTTAERLVVVLSAAYLQSGHGETEWRAFYAKKPSGEHGSLLPSESIPRTARKGQIWRTSRSPILR
jgi:hypothetical protein